MKESRKSAKDGRNADPMKEMRDRYERAVRADQDNRALALADLKFVTVPGHQWDEKQRLARKGRACYEFPILRSHWRQVVNDQKKARPGIKVRAVKDGTAKGAELRQGIIRNIESMSNAELAYDQAFELLTACGMGAWRVTTEYSEDDGWDQDIRVRPIKDALTSVWLDPDDLRNPSFGFIEQSMSRAKFKAEYPDAEAVDFESAGPLGYGDWFGKDDVRVAEYWRKVPVTRTLLLLSDGRTVDKAELTPELVQRLTEDGVTVTRERECRGHKVVSSIVSGREEISGPHDSVFKRIPIVLVYANLHFIEGKWTWAGMVRFSRDPQKLVNYNLTTAQEVLGKQHKATPILTPKMLGGDGVKALWDKSNVMELPYLPFTPDPQMPGGPQYLSPPPVHAAFAQMAQIGIDMLKASDGIFDESQGKASNATSGKAIIARQEQGDTATYDYLDALSFGIQLTGEIIVPALPKVYDTPRAIRVLGKDGGEDWVQLYQEVRNPETGRMETVNDLSAGKYDVTVTTGASYDTQRMEFVDMLTQLGTNNPAIAAGVPDLIIGSLDFPKADEAAERMKLLLPPPVQQAMARGKDLPPEAMAAMQQAEQAMGQAQEMGQMAEQAMTEAQQERAQVDAAKAGVAAQRSQIQSEIRVANAEFARQRAEFEAMQAKFEAHVAKTHASFAQREAAANTPNGGGSGEVAA